MSHNAGKILVQLAPIMREELTRVSKLRCQTRSECVRDAIRTLLENSQTPNYFNNGQNIGFVLAEEKN